MGFDENKGTYSRVCYLYVPEEFADADIAFLLMEEYKDVVFESGISENLVEVLDDSCVFVYAAQAKELTTVCSILRISNPNFCTKKIIIGGPNEHHRTYRRQY